MNWRNFLAGLHIIDKHVEDKSAFLLGAEHDEFYVYKPNTPLTKEEAAQMFDLGWQQPYCEERVYSEHEGWQALL